MQKEVSLKEVLILLLKRFKQIFIVAIVVAIIFGSLGLVKGYKNNVNQEALQSAKDAYLVKLGDYNTSIRQLNQEISTAEKQRESLLEYNENSMYFQFESSVVASKEIVFSIDTDYQIIPNMVYQTPDKTSKIVSAYADAYQSDALYNGISDIIGENIENKYLDELIHLKRAGDTKTVDGYGNVTVKHADTNGSIVVLKAIYSDQETANKIADFAFDILKDNIQKNVAPHTVTVISQSSKTQIDKDLLDLQEKNMEDLDKIQTTLTTKNATLNQKKKSEPVEPSVSAFGIVSKGILYGVAGGVIGGVLACLWVLTDFLTDVHLGNATAVEKMFGFQVFSIKIRETKKKKFILDPLIERLEGHQKREITPQESFDLAETNIRLLVKHNQIKNLLITGVGSCGEISEFTDYLKDKLDSVSIIYENNILYNSSALEALEKCDWVILAENTKTSTLVDVEKEIQKIKTLNKNILGIVFAEV